MKRVLRFNNVIKFIIILGDLCLLNAIFISLYYSFDSQTLGDVFLHSLAQCLLLLNVTYLICNYSNGVILHERIVRPERIVRRAIRNTLYHAAMFISLATLADIGTNSLRFFASFYVLFFVCLVPYRLTFRYCLKKYRERGGNTRTVVLIGSNLNMAELYEEMTGDPTTGFRVVGYFSEHPTHDFPEQVCYLGQPEQATAYLREHHIEQVYCCLPHAYCDEINPIINYCENHLIRFFSVPDVRGYLKRRMHFEMFGNVPVLTIREEPLSLPENRLLKRAFDLVFSSLFLCTLFPVIFIVFGIAIKLSSRGPVFFKQKRTGEDGKEFYCYKFRSMRVNAESDTLQATEHDPRKTKIGEFMRKTSIDETPQFINVFLGDMSVVGPRPHMLKHTEEYSRLIDKYMVRHFIKPGITGWAQVNGFRGETKELWQMEGRVKSDVWYLEHWTFLLDIYIIYKTIRDGIIGDKEAY